MPELLKGRALKLFIANKKQWKTWAEFIDSLHTYFLPGEFFTRLTPTTKSHATSSRAASTTRSSAQDSVSSTPATT